MFKFLQSLKSASAAAAAAAAAASTSKPVFIRTERSERLLITSDGQRISRKEHAKHYDGAVAAIDVVFPAELKRFYFEVVITEAGASWGGNVKLRFVEKLEGLQKVAGPDEPTNNRTLVVGDRVGLLRDDRGRSVYFLNGQSIGEISWLPNVPTNKPLHGIVDVYGKTISVELVEHSAVSSLAAPVTPQISRRFIKTTRGDRAVISDDGQKAARKDPTDEYTGATVAIDPPFPPDACHFEIVVTKQLTSWSGCVMLRFVERIEGLEPVPGADEPIDAVTITEGGRVGLTRDQRGRCVYTYNGRSLGEIHFLKSLPTNKPLWGVVDVYGKTAAVALVSSGAPAPPASSSSSSVSVAPAVPPLPPPPPQVPRVQGRRLVKTSGGERALIGDDGRMAKRKDPTDHFDGATVAIDPALPADKNYFEIIVTETPKQCSWAGHVKLRFVEKLEGLEKVAGQDEPTNKVDVKVGDHVGLLRDSNGRCIYFLNGRSIGEIAWLPSVPTNRPLFAVIDIYGKTSGIIWVENAATPPHTISLSTLSHPPAPNYTPAAPPASVPSMNVIGGTPPAFQQPVPVVVSASAAGSAPAQLNVIGDVPPKPGIQLTRSSTVAEVVLWLGSIGLGEYAGGFESNAINGEALFELSESDMTLLGMTKLGHKKILLGAIARLKL